MSDMDKQDEKQEAVPFFARYLEGQINFMEEISEEETQAVAGGQEITTLKYPSDNEDSSGSGIGVTEKYPSDCEDSSGGGLLNVTKKYPSDCEDSSGGGLLNNVTKKAPSDSDEWFVK